MLLQNFVISLFDLGSSITWLGLEIKTNNSIVHMEISV